mmetsp:Transcript_26177/g.78820  ORF Transcript_26177/g.78820 Transcript_26177/m.78820 type:complete len:120 (-) Transcript_26177:2915-3274(-)
MWCDLTSKIGNLKELVKHSTHPGGLQGHESWWGDDEDEDLDKLPRGIINPSDRRKIYWDAFVCLCVVYLTMTMPYSMGFNAEASCQSLASIDLSDKPWRACIRYGVDLAVDITNGCSCG